MAYGLEVYNNNGQTILTLDDRITRLHSVIQTKVYFPGGKQKSWHIPGASNDGTWVAVFSELLYNIQCKYVFTTDTLTVSHFAISASDSYIEKWDASIYVMRY